MAGIQTLSRGYTIALWVESALLAILGLAIENAAIPFAVAAVVGGVAWLRSNNSEYARPATTVVTCLLVVWPPVGSLLFFYWFLRVRTVESAA